MNQRQNVMDATVFRGLVLGEKLSHEIQNAGFRQFTNETLILYEQAKRISGVYNKRCADFMGKLFRKTGTY